MSPTFSERRPRSAARFRRAFVALIVSLALMCGVFVVLGYLQGPKLASAQVDQEAVTSQPGQQLRLFANQPVAAVSASQVSVMPPTPVSVSTSGDVVAVQFDGLLQYGTQYTVRVDGVTGASPSGLGALEYTFTTVSPTLYYVERGDAVDQLVRATLGAEDRAVVYSAASIRDVAIVGSAIAVVRDLEDGTSALDLVSPTEGLAEAVPLPGVGTVSDFDGSSAGASVGLVLGGRTLYTADLEVGRTFTPVADLGGDPLQVSGWRFIPGSTSLLALSTANSLFLTEAAAPGPLSPLGQLVELGRVSQDGTTVTGRDALGPVAVTIADGGRRALEFQPVGDGRGFIGETEVLRDGSMLERVALDAGDGSYRIVVAIDDGTQARIVYDGGGRVIQSFEVSPNGQLLALDLDGAQTVIVDIETGVARETLPGTLLRW